MDIPECIDEEMMKDVFTGSAGLTTRVLKALDLVKRSYAKRPGGEVYLTKHVFPVTKMACEFFGDACSEEVIIAALLHDVIGDGSISEAQFKDAFGAQAYALAKPLARPALPGIEDLSAAERWAVANLQQFKQLSAARYETKVIKLLDRIDNLHWAAAMQPQQLAVYLRETKDFYVPLAEETSIELHSTLQRMILKLEDAMPRRA